MGEFPGRARSAYSGTINIVTGCKSALSRGNLSTCRSDTPILGSGHVWLYPSDTAPTTIFIKILAENDFMVLDMIR